MAEQEKSTEDVSATSENEIINSTEETPHESVVSTEELALGDETETQPADPIDDTVIASDEDTYSDTEIPDENITAVDASVEEMVEGTVSEDSADAPVIETAALGETIPDETADSSILSLNDELETQPADPVSDNTESLIENQINPVTEQPVQSTVVAYPISASDGANKMQPPKNLPEDTMSDYQVMPESAWPPPMFVRRNITPQERYYLEQRWHSQWRFFDKKANDAKKYYLRLQRIIVIGSVTVPVLVSLDPDIVRGALNVGINAINFIPQLSFGFFTDSNIARLLIDTFTVILSLAVAIAAGLESLNKYGDNWSSYRQAAEELQAEKSFYDVSGGRYTNNPDSFSRFVERTEEIIAQTNGRFIASIDKQTQEAEKRSDEIINKDSKDMEQGTTIEPETTSYADSAAG